METNNNLYTKMARIMGNVNRMAKTGTNEHFKYKFVTDADVADTIRNELAQENIAFFASMTSVEQHDGHTVASFEFTFVCGDTGDTVTSLWFGESNDKQDKGISKAATSAEKFFLLKTFIISTGDPADDPDSDGRGDKPPQTRKTSPKTSAKPALRANTPAQPQPDADGYDPSLLADAPVNQANTTELLRYSVKVMPELGNVNHAGAALLLGLQESGAFDHKPTWGEVYDEQNNLMIADLWDALIAHYEKKAS